MTRPPRILLLNPTYLPTIGGVENSLYYLAQELARSGYEVTIAARLQHGLKERECDGNGVTVRRFELPLSRFPGRALELGAAATRSFIDRMLRESSVGQIWSRNLVTSWGALQSEFKGPIVHIYSTTAALHSRGTYLRTNGQSALRRLYCAALYPSSLWRSSSVEKQVLAGTHGVVFSRMMKTQLRSRGDFDVSVIHPGVDQSRFSRHAAREAVHQLLKERPELEVCRRIPTFLFVGRLAVAKNPYTLLRAFELLNCQARLILVGDGPEQTRIQSWLRQRSLEDKVFLVGSQRDALPAYYGLAKALVLPSTIESFGQVLIEAASCGIPSIAFSNRIDGYVTASDEIIEDGTTGFVVAEPSATALSAAMRRVTELDEQRWDQMSAQAEQHAASSYSWKAFVDQVLHLSSNARAGHEAYSG